MNISHAVCMATVELNPGLNKQDLKAYRGQHSVSHIRQDAMAAAREMGKLSFPQIARLFGGKHHTTVMHGVKQATTLRPQNVAAIVALAKQIMEKGDQQWD